jgi:hypothetical protein
MQVRKYFLLGLLLGLQVLAYDLSRHFRQFAMSRLDIQIVVACLDHEEFLDTRVIKSLGGLH